MFGRNLGDVAHTDLDRLTVHRYFHPMSRLVVELELTGRGWIWVVEWTTSVRQRQITVREVVITNDFWEILTSFTSDVRVDENPNLIDWLDAQRVGQPVRDQIVHAVRTGTPLNQHT